ncbi:hypothetical protein M3Y98_00561800 [Aphelenchoides besseyi]|nr:hypothetical protein M3Y98_00561800 [Aphelenchoides besseyi]KAI6193677.1 hypothetical protein M3Y96_01044100 [Aphelenchoides besseyi]
MYGTWAVHLVFVFSCVLATFGDSNPANSLSADYVKTLEKLGNDRLFQLQQFVLLKQQMNQDQMMKPVVDSQLTSPFAGYMNSAIPPAMQPIAKRSPGNHHIQQRAINQFKNCYFSPVQCVLLERRRRAMSFA